jgi:hypothetical protein
MSLESAGSLTTSYTLEFLPVGVEWALGEHQGGSYFSDGNEILNNVSARANYVLNSTERVHDAIFSTGSFARCTFRFNLWRKPVYYFLSLIVPGSMLVILSWLAMWTKGQS